MEQVERLRLARQKQEEMRKAGKLVVSTNPAQRLRARQQAGETVSPSLAIKAMCWHCMGGTADKWDSDTRACIRDCSSGPDSSTPCPLWEFRPYRGKQ